MSRKPGLVSRSLEYRAPETPRFLQALEAQVGSNSRYASCDSRDQLDSLVASCSARERKRATLHDKDDQDLDSEDELLGAQVVVLKPGKHLSRDEAIRLKTSAPQPESRTAQTHHIAVVSSSPGTNTAATSSKRRRIPIDSVDHAPHNATDPLDHVKQLIRSPSKNSNSNPKQDTRKPKANTLPNKPKPQPGKGLSFSFDDDA